MKFQLLAISATAGLLLSCSVEGKDKSDLVATFREFAEPQQSATDPHASPVSLLSRDRVGQRPAPFLAKAAWNPTAAELAALRQLSLERFQRYFPQGQLKARTGARDLIALALDDVASGGDPARIATTLQALQTLQDRNPSSSTYGNMHWYAGDTNLVDRNGIEFVVRHAGVLWLQYRDQLNPAARTALQEILTLAKTGITRHNVAISYTNIYLMKAWNLIALGEGTGDTALAAQGQRMLRDWLDWTGRNGIGEYLSPDYYAVNLECLALIRNLSQDQTTQRLAQVGLDAVWSDVALNWYAPAQRLGATHSRDYSRLYNSGDLNALVARAGWPASSTRSPDPGPYGLFAWSAPSAAASAWLSTGLPRTVSTRWGPAAEQRQHHHLAADFSIGSSESGYHDMDTAPLAVSLGSGNDVPVVTWTLDGRRDHYGTLRSVEAGSGHWKSLHLRPFITSVQRGPEVLFLAHGAQTPVIADAALESTVILPSEARYWLDGRPLNVTAYRSRWLVEPAANGSSTFFSIVKEGSRDLVKLEDRDTSRGVGISRYFPVSAGQQYRLRARLAGGTVLLYINFFDAQGKLIGAQRSQRVGGNPQEVEYSFSQTAPSGAARAQAWLYSTGSNQASISLGDLAFEQVPATGSATVLGNFDFRVHEPQQINIPMGSTLVLQRETAALALRAIDVRNTQGSPISLTLHNDGLQHGALRLTAVHADRTTTSPGSVALWALARGGLDNGFDGSKALAFRTEAGSMTSELIFTAGVMDVTTRRGSAAPLRLRADLPRKLRLLREGGDVVPANSSRSINGQDIGFAQEQPGSQITLANTGPAAWRGPNGETCTEANVRVFTTRVNASALGAEATCVWLRQGINIDADVTLTAARIDAKVSTHPQRRSIVLNYCAINPTTPADWSLGPENFSATRCQILGSSDGVRHTGAGTGVLIENFIRVTAEGRQDNNDGVQISGATGGGVILRNNIDVRPMGGGGRPTVALFIGGGAQGNYEIRDNYLVGGGYALRLNENGFYSVTGNVIELGSYSIGPLNTTNARTGGFLEWTNNRLSDGTELTR